MVIGCYFIEGEYMKILIICMVGIIIAITAFFIFCLCASCQSDELEDEEQIEYLSNWSKTHNKRRSKNWND